MNRPAVGIGLAVMALPMSVLWLVRRRMGDAGIGDAGWTFGVGLLALFAAASGEGLESRRVLLAALVGIWCLRSGGRLLRDPGSTDHERGSDRMLREKRGDRAPALLFAFFSARAALGVLVALPFFLIAESSEALGPFDLLGLVPWSAALLGESIAERRLARFRAGPSNRGPVCRLGRRRSSRHPNAFFEWVHWWTYPFLAVTGPFWPATIIVPLVMLFPLLRWTGVSFPAKQALPGGGEPCRRRQGETSMFLPWPRQTQEEIG